MIYFDNGATTKVSESVIDIVNDVMRNNFANPSSIHSAGFKSEKAVNLAREKIAKNLKVKPEEIFFTSGGTESNNLALFGAAESYKRRAKKIITLSTEHPSVKESCEELSKRGFEIIYADIDGKGYAHIDDIIDDDTLMISIMQVNNEFGTIQDIESLAEKAKKINKDIIIHADGVQGFGKHRINLKNIDLYSFSGHKIHAPKGIGGLYIKKGIRLKSIIFGGQQQQKIRPGTENTSGIAALGKACEESFEKIDDNFKKVSEIKKSMAQITDEIEDTIINGDYENGSPYILSIDFKNVKGEALVHSLEKREIYVSTGSACSSRSKKKPAVYYINPESEGTVRFSFSPMNTIEETEECKKALKEIVPNLRRYRRR